MEGQTITQPANPAIASRHSRYVDALIDNSILYILLTVAVATVFHENIQHVQDLQAYLQNLPFIMVFTFVLCWLYWTTFEIIWNKTPGKFITGNRVCSKNGGAPAFSATALRTLCRFIPFEFISFFSSYPVGWHDRFSGTIVVNERSTAQPPRNIYRDLGLFFLEFIGIQVLLLLASALLSPFIARLIPHTLQNTNAPSRTNQASSSSKTDNVDNNALVTYEHPDLHYTLQYPASWKGETGEKFGEANYRQFQATSQDYALNNTGFLKSGVEVLILVDKTKYQSIDDKRAHVPILPSESNLVRTTVDGAAAVQTDLSLSGFTETTVDFVKDGKIYDISFIYPNTTTKQAYWQTFQNLIRSFKTH